MEIDDASDLIYYTYYMMDWNKVRQSSSDVKCVSCGKAMNLVEEVRDRKSGLKYEGRVCHNCKRLLWIKSD